MNWLIVGKSGTGKSYFARRLVERLSEGKNLIVVDNSTDHDEIEGIYPIEIHQGNISKLSTRKILERVERALLFFTYTEQRSVNRFLDKLCETIWDYKNTVLMIDEAHIFFPRSDYPRGIEMLIRAGRKGGIDTVLITQNFTDLNITALKQAHYLAVFRLTEQNEIERIARRFPEARRIVPDLPEYHLMFIDFMKGKYEVIKNDSI